MAANRPKIQRSSIKHYADNSLSVDIETKLARFDKLILNSDVPSFVDIHGNQWLVDVWPERLYTMKQNDEIGVDAFCCKWNNDGQQYAVGSSLGNIDIYTRYNGKARTLHTGKITPCSSLHWVTFKGTQSSQFAQNSEEDVTGISFADEVEEDVTGKQALLATYIDGTVMLWNPAIRDTMFKISEGNNKINCSGYNYGKQEFCTAGSDRSIRIYDLETYKQKDELVSGYDKSRKSLRHNNRIFSLCYKSDDINIIFSGSWDDNIFAWDTRTNDIVRSIYGPHIAGQTVSYQNGMILTGSWRPDYGLEQWDFGTGKCVKRLGVKAAFANADGQNLVESLLIYNSMYIPDSGIGSNGVKMNQVGICCGSGANCVLFFDMKTGAFTKEVGLNDDAYRDIESDEIPNEQMSKTKIADDGIDKIELAKSAIWSLADKDEDEEQEQAKQQRSKVMRNLISAGGGIYCVDVDPLGEYIVYGGHQGKIGVARIELGKGDAIKPDYSRRSSFATADLLNL